MLGNFLTIDEQLLKKIYQRELLLRVHSKFKNSINFNKENKNIFITLYKGNYAGPNRITINENSDLFSKFEPEEKVYFYLEKNQLFINDYKYYFNKIIPINLKLQKLNFQKKIILQNNRNKLRKIFIKNFYLSKQKNFIYKKIFTILEKAKEDINYLKELIGLGYGLTPSGDDIILGIIIHLIIFERKKELFFLKKFLSKTNQISQFYLKNGFAKKFDELILKFIYSLTEKNFDNIYYNELLKYGHTSGEDILLGFLYYEKNFKNEGKK